MSCDGRFRSSAQIAFARRVNAILVKTLYGEINTHYDHSTDILFVKISNLGQTFTYRYGYVSAGIMNGITEDICADKIIEVYTKWLERFVIKEN